MNNSVKPQPTKYVPDPSAWLRRSGQAGPGLVVLVNGQHHSHLPERLDTLLRDGDEVAIFPPLMGG